MKPKPALDPCLRDIKNIIDAGGLDNVTCNELEIEEEVDGRLVKRKVLEIVDQTYGEMILIADMAAAEDIMLSLRLTPHPISTTDPNYNTFFQYLAHKVGDADLIFHPVNENNEESFAASTRFTWARPNLLKIALEHHLSLMGNFFARHADDISGKFYSCGF